MSARINMKDFTTFTGKEMLKIDIANTYGLDKEDWETRLEGADTIIADAVKNIDTIAFHKESASEPLLMERAVNSYLTAMKGLPLSHNAYMDATASGIQILAVLSDCRETAINSNVLNSGKRMDPYTLVASKMQEYLPKSEMFEGLEFSQVRGLVKKPIMTHFYNSTAKPQEIFGEDSEELVVFYEVLEELFPGAIAVMELINEAWDSTALEHTWTLPDGHVARCLVRDKVDTSIEIDELDAQNSFAYRFYPNQPSTKGTSLMPNVIHSIDAYIVREMVRRAKAQGFELAAIHDAFTCHPNNMVRAMMNYREILHEISASTLLNDILTEITGENPGIESDYDITDEILESQYGLC